VNGRSLITSEQSADLVSYTVLVSGNELPDAIQLLDINVHLELNRIPYAKLIILDGDATSSDFPISNEVLFLPGKPIEIAMGYRSVNETVFKGFITTHRLKIRDGLTQLIIECRDHSTKMTVCRRSGYFYDSKDSDVMETIIGRNGLKADVAPSNFSFPELVQYHTTDWDFLITRAQANGMVCLANQGKISVFRPDLSQESLGTVAFGFSVLEFDAEIDGRLQYGQVNAYGWNPADGELMEIEGRNPGIEITGNVMPDDLSGLLGTDKLDLKNGGKLSDVILQDWANAKWLFQQLAKVRGRVRFQGVSGIKPGDVITLEGVGDRFTGDVYVSGLIHHFAEGSWTVDVQFGMNPEWFTETYDIHATSASGLFGAIRGLQIGIVTQLQDDPEGEERIMVKIPIINTQEQGIWCRIGNLDAGRERGTFFRPEIGDEVVVGFINEDPNQAIVLGMLHSSANPSPKAATDDNHEKGYISRSGIQFIFDDEKKAVVIETPKGKRLTLNEADDEISFADDHGHSITMDANGISVESAGDIVVKSTGDLTLEGMNVTIKANSQFKAEGSGGAEVSTSAVAVIKGSLVQIN
jgi:Rhs element Vgr protein